MSRLVWTPVMILTLIFTFVTTSWVELICMDSGEEFLMSVLCPTENFPSAT